MKDSEGTDLVRGDLVMLTIENPVEHPAELIIFLENDAVVVNTDLNGDDKVDTTTTTESGPTTHLRALTSQSYTVIPCAWFIVCVPSAPGGGREAVAT